MKSFCIIGLGKFGLTLATTLAAENNQVLVIDMDKDVINSIADSVTNAVVGDPTNEAVLRAAGVSDYDCAIVCIASNVNDSTLITLMLKDLGVKYVVARAGSDHHKRVLQKIGADLIVFPEQDMGEKLANVLSRKNIIEYIEFSEDYLIVERIAPAKWVGKSLRELNIRSKYGVTVIALGDAASDNLTVSPNPDMALEKDTMVTIMGKRDDINKISDMN